jgi:hypothetical protein
LSPTVVRSSRTLVPLAFVALSAVLLGACATGQPLEIKKVDAAVQAPANVALYLKITREDGQPVTLLPGDFKVFEDGKQIPPKKVRRALLPVKYAVDRYVLVVVDLSGPLVDSEYLSTLQDAVATLAERVGKDARMGLSAFDGDGIVPFIGLEGGDPHAGLVAMRKFRPRSRNIDLWGAFLTSLDALDAAAGKSAVPHQKATLILVTDRKDKAGRHSAEEALARVQKSKADVYVIGIGDGIDREALEPLGKTGALFAAEARELEKPFLEIADRVEAQLGEDYLFSYCSPQKGKKKGGKHSAELRIETKRWHGAVDYEFSTRAFTAEACDPQAKPDFKTASAQGSAADGGGEGAGQDDGDEKSPKGKSGKSGKAGKSGNDGNAPKKPKPAEDEEES